jgi:hypothetical protein
MIRNAPPKHPASSKWYWLEWSADELQDATITASSWTVPAGLTKDAEMQSGLKVGVRVSGGNEGDSVEVINQITTSDSQTLHQRLQIRINDSGH